MADRTDDRMVLNQALAVPRKDRGHPNRVVHGAPEKPAENQVVRSLLHELASRADALALGILPAERGLPE